MNGDETIRAALERSAETLATDTTAGRGTAKTTVRLQPHLTCEVEEGPWRFAVSMPEKYGGANVAPNPGVFGRAAVGSCLAIGYGMWAARLGVPIDALEVEVQADYDTRGELAVSDEIPPGYLAMRYVITVDSPASEADIVRVLDTADRYSSWRDDITRALPLIREIRLAARSR